MLSLKSKWDSVELYNRYRHAYEVIIVAVLIYVIEVVPPALLHHPELLMKFADEEYKGTSGLFCQMIGCRCNGLNPF